MPRWLLAFRLRRRSLLQRAAVERELDEELQYHLDHLVAAEIGAGLSPARARAAALKRMGGVGQTKEQCRDARRVRWLEDFWQDLRTGVRAMRAAPGVASVALLTLAMIIGANTAVFSVINGVLLQPAYPDASRIVWVLEQTPRGDLSAVSTLNYLDWQKESRSFEALAAWGAGSITLGGDVPLPLRAMFVSTDFFTVFGTSPLLGRTFRAEEQEPGRERVAILSDRLWTSRFGRDPGVIGRHVRLRGEPYEIVGVMPAAMSQGEWGWSEVWLPRTFTPQNMTRDYRAFNVYGKLRPGVSLREARAEMTTIAGRLSQAFPASNRGWSVSITPYSELFVNRGLRRTLLLVLGAVGVVLLIGCLNLANMLTARAMAKRQETATRSALGGGRARLFRQAATESLLLAGIGGTLGLVTAAGMMAGFRRVLPAYASANGGLPPSDTVHMSGSVLLFTLIVSLVTSVVFGMLPAVTAMRSSLAAPMKAKAPTRTQQRLRHGLVIAEIALAFVLLTTAGSLGRRLVALQRTDLGFHAENVLTATLPLSTERTLGPPADRQRYFERVIEAIERVPGTRRAAVTSVLPLQGPGAEVPFARPEEAAADRASRPTASLKMVSSGYVEALGLRLVRGRAFQPADGPANPRVALVNEVLAARYFAGQDPIGQLLAVPEMVAAGRTRLGPDFQWQIVGMVADERTTRLGDDSQTPAIYVPLAQSPTKRPSLVVRTDTAPDRFAEAIRKAVAQVDADQPLADVRTIDALKTEALGSDRHRAWLLSLMAGLALLLAAIGIYGVLSYAVIERRHELAVRAAVGASRQMLLRLVMGRGLMLTTQGLLLGFALSWATTRVLGGLLVGVGGLDGFTVALASTVIVLVAVAACAAPARAAKGRYTDLRE